MMNDRIFSGGADRLRAPERVALLEVDRVTGLCLDGLDVRTALDVGTGSGIFAESLAARGLAVAGIDRNPEMVTAARQYVPNGDFREGVAEAIPFSDESFDLVFMGLVLHETDEALGALKEAHRVAIKRVAVLEWPYVEGEKGPPLAHRLKPETVSELANQAGFKQVERVPLQNLDLYLMTR